MDGRRIDRHLRMLALARDCVALGARKSTVCTVTGLPFHIIVELLSCRSLSVPGRVPLSIWHVVGGPVLRAVEASEICRIFEKLTGLGVSEADALVTTYRLYAVRFAGSGNGSQRKRRIEGLEQLDISFDRAFELVRSTFGSWGGQRQAQMATCSTCFSRYLVCIGVIPTNDVECPYCRLTLYTKCRPRLLRRLRKPSCDAGDSGPKPAAAAGTGVAVTPC